MASLFAAGLIAFVMGIILTVAVRRMAVSLGTMDVPNERSSHSAPTPRGGGASFAVIIAASAACLAIRDSSVPLGFLAVCATGVAVISYIDDLRNVPAAVRFSIQTVAAIIFVSAITFTIPQVPAVLVGAAVVFWIVSLTNIFNFMDGIDGMAASQAVIAFTAVGAYSMSVSDNELMALCLIAASATAGFLVLNWAPARIFMGDVGSAFLGFSCACLSVIRGEPSAAAVVVWAIWPFIFDATVTLLRRISKRENVLRAHRSHFYQRLTITCYSHAFVTTLSSACAIITAAFGLLAASSRISWAAATITPLLFSAILPLFVRFSERHQRSKKTG